MNDEVQKVEGRESGYELKKFEVLDDWGEFELCGDDDDGKESDRCRGT